MPRAGHVDPPAAWPTCPHCAWRLLPWAEFRGAPETAPPLWPVLSRPWVRPFSLFLPARGRGAFPMDLLVYGLVWPFLLADWLWRQGRRASLERQLGPGSRRLMCPNCLRLPH